MRKNRGESEQFLWTLLYCALLEATVNASFGASVAGNSLSKDEEGKNGYRQVATKSIPLIAHELSLAASEGLHRSNLLALNPTKRTDAARYPPLQPYLRPSRSLILHASWPSSASPSPPAQRRAPRLPNLRDLLRTFERDGPPRHGWGRGLRMS